MKTDEDISKIFKLHIKSNEFNKKQITVLNELFRDITVFVENKVVDNYRNGFRAGSSFKKNNQEILLDFINGYQAKNGISPTLQEMKTAIACKSITSVQRALVSLEKQGLVTRDKYQKRAWRIKET